MSRSLQNKPIYYDTLNTKQQRNWRRNTRRIERNEEVRSTYSPYHPSSNMIVFHLHHQTEVGTIEELIKKAEQTELYALDTESQSINRQNHGALIQIQMIHSVRSSTVILIETNFLPNPESLFYQKMKKLWSTIFSNGHKILSWGPYADEMKNFNDIDLINSGKSFEKINLQFWFQEWYEAKAHPEMESRDHGTGFELELEASDDDDIFGYGDQIKLKKNKSINEWSLQAAVSEVFNKFLDKTETENDWQCGIDLQLGTWKQKLFSKKQYDQQREQKQRLNMRKYAIHDCAVLSELYFHMYPEKASVYQEPTTISSTPKTTPTATVITTAAPTVIIDDDIDHPYDTEDELVEALKPKLNRQPIKLTFTTAAAPIVNVNGYTDRVSDVEHELVEALKPKLNQQLLKSTFTTTRTTTTSDEQRRKERQRRNNEKYKAKKKFKPSFQNKILRPIYYKYNYQTIRAQLLDDNIFTSHQLTISPDHTEVMIGFTSNEAKERAKLIIRTNYVSYNQYIKRWSGN